MATFQLRSDFKPEGDQPEAIRRLMQGLREKKKFQTLLGVTGSGKTKVTEDLRPNPVIP